MSELEQFRMRVERFIERHNWTATRFGREMAADPQFVFNLREGREPRAETRNKITDMIQKKSKKQIQMQAHPFELE